MNAIALMLCSVIAGADAKETIPTSQKLFNVIDGVYAIRKNPRIEVAEDGTTIQAKGTPSGDKAKPDEAKKSVVVLYRYNDVAYYLFGEYQLKVAPCPGHPNFLLAGYEMQERNQRYVEGRVLRYYGCVLIDTERNIVVPLDDDKQQLFLTDDDFNAVQDQCNAMWTKYLQNIEEQSGDAPFYHDFKQLRRQFIQMPEYDVNAVTFFVPKMPAVQQYPTAAPTVTPMRVARMTGLLQISANGRKIEHNGSLEVQALLSTTIAMPAKEYFAK